MNTRGIAAEYRLSNWVELLQSRISEGLSIEAFCQVRGISKNTYFYWQRKIRKAACEQLALRQSGIEGVNPSGFAEVKMAERPALPEMPGTCKVHVEYGGVQLTFDSTYPPEKLAAVIRGLART